MKQGSPVAVPRTPTHCLADLPCNPLPVFITSSLFMSWVKGHDLEVLSQGHCHLAVLHIISRPETINIWNS